MAVILLDISRLFATKVPGKIDADVYSSYGRCVV
jgi:hypothetical protein